MGVLPIFRVFQKKAWERLELTETQRRMYTAERLENFRWISKLVATYSKYELREEDVISEELCQWLQEVGQFAEVVYATPPLESLLRNYDSMKQRGFPFEGYYALSPRPYLTSALPLASTPLDSNLHPRLSIMSCGVRLLRCLKGQVAKLPAAVFSRWIHEHGCLGMSVQDKVDQDARGDCSCTHQRQQIIVSISGTSSLQQAIHDLRAIRRPYSGTIETDAATVHTGFWDLYQGMRSALMEGIQDGLQLSPFEGDGRLKNLSRGCFEPSDADDDISRELIVTGHSMGGAIAHLLCIDLLSPTLSSDGNAKPQSSLRDVDSLDECASSPTRYNGKSYLQRLGLKSLEIITFGEPRTGNKALVDHWVTLRKQHQDEYGIPIREWCVKAFNDGVPSLPLITFGYRHFSQEPLYAVNGKVYRVPSDEREYALFRVASAGAPDSASRPSPQVASDSEYPEQDAAQVPIIALYSAAQNPPSGSPIPLSPLGGHNYYNERDLEGRFLRRMEWLEKSVFDQDGWEDRYRAIIKNHPT